MFRRYRFRTDPDGQQRPVRWPPAGPYWCTGYGGGWNAGGEPEFAMMVAYLPRAADLLEWWPQAWQIEFQDCDVITFTDRFPRPDWWPVVVERAAK